MSASLKLYESLSNFRAIENLIDQGETEGLHLECKSPQNPTLNKEMKNKLAKNISAFSNTEGGVIIWGVSTTNHGHTGLDLLTQIEPIGNCKRFLKQIETAIPSQTTPSLTNCLNKVITKRKKDTKGIVITHIPKLESDPVQASFDENFYFRCGDDCEKMPYEMIKRLFAATSAPDLHCKFPTDIAKKESSGEWKIPIIIENKSSAVASDIAASVEILNADSCEKAIANHLRDISDINPEVKVFAADIKGVIHRGFSLNIGDLLVKLKGQKRSLKLKARIFANNMRAREFVCNLKLTNKKLSVDSNTMNFIY